MRLTQIILKRGESLLVNGGDLPLEQGKVTVIFGPSGSGKSTLLYALADLDPSVSLTSSAGPQPLKDEIVGLVPQNFAVFEDLRTARRNIAFAHAHAPRTPNGMKLADKLKHAENNLGVSPDWKTPLSGGQKQRVSIARALSGEARILLCDEPTSGLDPVSRADAIKTLRNVARSGVAVVVVTHDLEWNSDASADYAVVLREGVLASHPVGTPLDNNFFRPNQRKSLRPREPLWQQICRRLGETVWWLFFLPVQILRGFISTPRVSPFWLLLMLRHFGMIVLGPSSIVYLLIAGGLIGFSSFFFSLGSLQPSPHLQEILIPELLSGSGFGLYRVIVPLITALLVAAKCGSALAADFGNRQYGGQIAVMRTLGANPETYLAFSAIATLAIGLPILNVLAFGAAALGSLFAYLYSFPVESAYSWQGDFFRLLSYQGSRWFDGTFWNIGKLALSGIGVAVISYRFGTLPKSSNTAIGSDISRATLWGSLWCLTIFAFFAFFEF